MEDRIARDQRISELERQLQDTNQARLDLLSQLKVDTSNQFMQQSFVSRSLDLGRSGWGPTQRSGIENPDSVREALRLEQEAHRDTTMVKNKLLLHLREAERRLAEVSQQHELFKASEGEREQVVERMENQLAEALNAQRSERQLQHREMQQKETELLAARQEISKLDEGHTADLEKYTKENAAKEEEIKALQRRVEDLEDEKRDLQADAAKRESRQADALMAVERERAQLQDTVTVLNAARQDDGLATELKLEELQKEMASLKDARSKENANNKAKFKSQVEALDKEIRSKEEALADAGSLLKSAQKEIALLRENVRDHHQSQQKAEAEAEMEAEKTRLSEQSGMRKSQQLLEELAQMRAQHREVVQRMEDRIKDAERKTEVVMEQLQAAEVDKRTALVAGEKLAAEARQMKQTLAAAEQGSLRLKDEAAREGVALARSTFKEEMDQLAHERDNAIVKAQDLAAKVQVAGVLQGEYEKLREVHKDSAAKIAALKGQVAQLEEEVASATEKLEEVGAEKSKFEREAATSEALIALLKAERSQLQQEQLDLNRQIGEYKTNCERIESDLEQAVASCEVLEIRNHDLVQENEDLLVALGTKQPAAAAPLPYEEVVKTYTGGYRSRASSFADEGAVEVASAPAPAAPATGASHAKPPLPSKPQQASAPAPAAVPETRPPVASAGGPGAAATPMAEIMALLGSLQSEVRDLKLSGVGNTPSSAAASVTGATAPEDTASAAPVAAAGAAPMESSLLVPVEYPKTASPSAPAVPESGATEAHILDLGESVLQETIGEPKRPNVYPEVQDETEDVSPIVIQEAKRDELDNFEKRIKEFMRQEKQREQAEEECKMQVDIASPDEEEELEENMTAEQGKAVEAMAVEVAMEVLEETGAADAVPQPAGPVSVPSQSLQEPNTASPLQPKGKQATQQPISPVDPDTSSALVVPAATAGSSSAAVDPAAAVSELKQQLETNQLLIESRIRKEEGARIQLQDFLIRRMAERRAESDLEQKKARTPKKVAPAAAMAPVPVTASAAVSASVPRRPKQPKKAKVVGVAPKMASHFQGQAEATAKRATPKVGRRTTAKPPSRAGKRTATKPPVPDISRKIMGSKKGRNNVSADGKKKTRVKKARRISRESNEPLSPSRWSVSDVDASIVHAVGVKELEEFAQDVAPAPKAPPSRQSLLDRLSRPKRMATGVRKTAVDKK